MRLLVVLTLFLANSLHGQTYYTGIYGEFNHKWTLKINEDSSIVLLCNIDNYGYEEYKGSLSKDNDTLFTIKARLNFAQCACKSVNDSVLYVLVDTNSSKIQNISVTYFNSSTNSFPLYSKPELIIPVDYRALRSNSSFFFYVSANHYDPIYKNEIRTYYNKKGSYCVEIFARNEESFKVIITNDKIWKIGKGNIENFKLSKTKNTSKSIGKNK